MQRQHGLWVGILIAATSLGVAQAYAQHIGGHVGVALPLATFSTETTTIADSTVIASPIGIGFELNDTLKVDFETIVLTKVSPGGGTTFVVDPGLIYNWGWAATGLRVAFQIGESANVGCIPLLNVPLIATPDVTWFIEAAFPIFYADHRGSLTTVLHTGVGF